MTVHHLVISTPARRRNARLTDEDVEEDFKKWYALYPRKIDPRKALKAYRAAINRGAAPYDMMEGVRRYAAQVRGADKHHIKHPTTWLNADAWLSEDEPPPTTPISIGTQQSPRHVLERSLFPSRSPDFSRHFLSYVVQPAERLHLSGALDRGVLTSHLGYLYLKVEEQRRAAKFTMHDYDSLGSDSVLLRGYVDWLYEQGWHTASVAVLQFDSPAFSQFRRETALQDQFGRDPITKRSRFSGI